jgi:SAM-dependent methyltransferase
MFCARPERAAQELARVCRPGGRLALTTWSTSGSVREVFEMIAGYKCAASDPNGPQPPSPFDWGDTNRLIELLGDDFDLGFEEGTTYYRTRDGAAAFGAFASGFGPVVTLLDELDEEAAESFRCEFELFHERHRTGVGVLVPREYVVTIGRRHT